jgi:transcriptional regulator with XRE-family HTH domain
MDSDNLLGEFLRARREVTTPRQVGLLHSGPRRTPGLRREELAMLAEVSTDYYIRLEQGRERHPSERVLGALVRVLDLGPDAAAHLYELAHPRPRRRARTGEPEQVSPDLLRLMRSWPDTPALVFGRWMDVLATNSLAAALYDGLEHRETSARAKVAHLRATAGANLDDPYLIGLVDELSRESADFRRLWARHDVIGKTREAKRLRHRDVGDLTLSCEVFNVNSAPGQQLLIFQAEPGSPSERGLALLGSLAVMMA